ncbi:peptidoglycan DD-metalloendopeptidase family protein [Actinokineospora sp.]|uniref:peptidoglycan DD-metalloendopeptidase family protein n=1 Tax=Actinokineospora sp. TaxID=1872133 RepID=UPI0040377B1E
MKYLLVKTRLLTVTVVGVGVLVLPAPANAAATADLTESVSTAALAKPGVERSGAAPVVETTRQVSGTWAFGSTTVPLSAAAHGTPQSSLFVAHKVDGRWVTALSGSTDFVDLVGRAPAGLVSDSERKLFTENQVNAQEIPADTGLSLPWPTGVAWYMGGGPHGNSAAVPPFSSIDFNGGDGRVLSAGPGKVYKSCVRNGSGLVKVVHPNGYSTTYYHMTDLTTLADGADVQVGTYLGKTGNGLPCGGSSSGAHVHFSLLHGDSHIGVGGRTIGGWTFTEGDTPYRGQAEHDGRRVRPGGRLVNYGATTPPGPPPVLPTSTVDAGQNAAVNLREGPGSRYRVVGQVTSGTVVRVTCSARGSRVRGIRGSTTLWDKLDSGQWISDGFVVGPPAPACPR